ncbi:MAG: hypothetical protein J0H17_18675 [Rhizobiales bacterium]|nr:hypothetical protein [Hyphomicrobiales bacterium]
MTKIDPKQILTELRRLRSRAPRAEAAAGVKKVAAQIAADDGPAELLTAQCRETAAEMTAALAKAYEDTSKLVPDRLWADVDRAMVEWVKAEQ